MAEGLTNTGIAKRLQLSERTVEAHVRHLLGKLDLPDGEDDHRRVRAVLAHLAASQGRPAAGRGGPMDTIVRAREAGLGRTDPPVSR